jgi:hypothetical protein
MAASSHSTGIGASGATRRGTQALARPREALGRLRLALGWVVLLGAAAFLFGTSWDIQWHSFIGRDRALVPPHQLMLGGILLCGVAALAEVAVESVWARSTPAVAGLSTPFAGAFYGSLGAYVAGFGALAAAVGFPLDVYWHALYGIDVSVWAPFHVMIITGMSIVALGAAYMLLSGVNLLAIQPEAPAETPTEAQTSNAGLALAGHVGVVIASAVMLCVLLFYLDASFSNAALHLFGLMISTYPLMVGAFGAFALCLVVRAWPAPFAALKVAAVFYAIDALVFLVVPPLTDALARAEHESYRRGVAPSIVVMSWLWPLTLFIAAALIDWAAWRARRRDLSLAAANRLIVAAAVVGLVLVALLDPLYFAMALAALSRGDLTAGGLISFVGALILGGLGAWGGSRLGLDIGAALANADR